MDCIFCKIINKELPSYTIYEDKRMMAILDINPVNKGHLLVLPKEHHNNLIDTPMDLVKDLMAKAKELAKVQLEALGIKGFNLLVNNGEVAGQLVEHLHIHLIPRLPNDNLHHWPGKSLTDEEMKRIADNLIKLV